MDIVYNVVESDDEVVVLEEVLQDYSHVNQLELVSGHGSVRSVYDMDYRGIEQNDQLRTSQYETFDQRNVQLINNMKNFVNNPSSRIQNSTSTAQSYTSHLVTATSPTVVRCISTEPRSPQSEVGDKGFDSKPLESPLSVPDFVGEEAALIDNVSNHSSNSPCRTLTPRSDFTLSSSPKAARPVPTELRSPSIEFNEAIEFFLAQQSAENSPNPALADVDKGQECLFDIPNPSPPHNSPCKSWTSPSDGSVPSSPTIVRHIPTSPRSVGPENGTAAGHSEGESFKIPSLIPKRVPPKKKRKEVSKEKPCSNFEFCHHTVLNPPRDTSLSPFCLQCSFWIHAYDYKENFCISSGSSDCIFCLQLKKNTGKVNLSYVNEESLSYDPVAVKISMLDYMRLVPQVPTKNPSTWKFFYNYERNKNDMDSGFNVKLGDLVYIAQATDEEMSQARTLIQRHRKAIAYVPKDKRDIKKFAYAMRIEYIIEEAGIPFISGYNFYSPEQVQKRQAEMEQRRSTPKNAKEVELERRFLKSVEEQPKQLILVNDYNSWAPLNSVTATASVFLRDDFEAGKATGYGKDATFLSCWQYSYRDNVLDVYTKDKYHRRCKNDVVFKLKGKKTQNQQGPAAKSTSAIEEKPGPKSKKKVAGQLPGPKSSKNEILKKPGPKSRTEGIELRSSPKSKMNLPELSSKSKIIDSVISANIPGPKSKTKGTELIPGPKSKTSTDHDPGSKILEKETAANIPGPKSMTKVNYSKPGPKSKKKVAESLETDELIPSVPATRTFPGPKRLKKETT
ncbi:hypothetical protein HDE_09343 [Halotydeus destructor]|nr:hypothetical protein HDE_09343 [Halotydeus destructor]